MWQAISILRSAVAAVRPDRLLTDRWDEDLDALRPDPGGRLILAAIGKASLPFAHAIEARFVGQSVVGLAVVPHGYPRFETPLPRFVEVIEAGHPVPDVASLTAGSRLLQLADEAREGDLFLVAVSGGGSALAPVLPDGISLPDWQNLTRLLLHAGLPISEINIVRRALSLTAGGRLAQRAAPARVAGLILSDVPGDDPGTVAGGPTVRSLDKPGDAHEILRRWGIRDRVPRAVLAVLESGGVPPAHPQGVLNRLIGSNGDARLAAAHAAAALGYRPVVVSEPLQGEAREVGARLARESAQSAGDGSSCLIWGGETTVTVTGTGRGGRCQELALSAAMELASKRADQVIGLLAAGTDGLDGPTPVAGAWVTPDTWSRARSAGLDPIHFLENHDAFQFFDRMGGHVVTGATHTNVMDLVLALVH